MNQYLPASILIIFLFTTCTTPTPQSDLIALNGSTMGTVYTVKILRSDLARTDIQKDSLHNKIDSLLNQINKKMSTYLSDSEISIFNQHQKSDWFPVSVELAIVVKNAIDISAESQGAFDITIGPLVNLWGFGPENRPELIPSEQEISTRRLSVGYKNLEVRADPPGLRKKRRDLYCDLSAIAKGYGVDQVALFLEKTGCPNYMVDIGGEIKAGGKRSQDNYWKIGVATPEEKLGIQKVILLYNQAVATSGDYRNYFEKDGIRYSHMIDPRTGRPVTHHLASVTVLHDSCMVADALATAIDIMGPETGFEFALKRELPVFLIVRKGNGFVEKMTPEFEKILELN